MTSVTNIKLTVASTCHLSGYYIGLHTCTGLKAESSAKYRKSDIDRASDIKNAEHLILQIQKT